MGALGVTADGTKVPLGVVEGSTENATVCRGLLSGLESEAWTPPAESSSSSTAARPSRAVKDVFGAKALIQRCRLHKERGLMDYLPEAERPWVARKLRQAWKNPNADEAIRDLRALATRLERINPDAAGCLRKGLEQMFTVTRLGITGTLLRTLISTNPMESMIDIVRQRSRNVKRWQDGDMRLRWAAAGMLTAEEQFRRVKGYKQLPQLADALGRATADSDEPPVGCSLPDRMIHQEAATKFHGKRVILFQRFPERFGDCVVGCHPGAAGGGAELMGLAEGQVVVAGVLTALVGMGDHDGGRAPSGGDGHGQGVEDEPVRMWSAME